MKFSDRKDFPQLTLHQFLYYFIDGDNWVTINYHYGDDETVKGSLTAPVSKIISSSNEFIKLLKTKKVISIHASENYMLHIYIDESGKSDDYVKSKGGN